MKERLRRIPPLRALLDVQERFGEINGTALANGIALQTFLSIFPLLLFAIAAIGFIADDDPSFAGDVIDSLSLDGSAGQTVRDAIDTAKDSKEAASLLGLAGLLWSGLNVVGAIQRAVDRAWQSFGKGLRNKLRAAVWFVGAVLIFTVSFALSILINFLPGFFAPLSIGAGLAVNVALFLWTFAALGRDHVGLRELLPGAVFCAVGFEAMKLVGSLYVPQLVQNSSELYGPLGVVFAILAWLAVFGRLFVYGAVVNVIRFEERHGTVSVPVRVPRLAGSVPLEANRAGAVVERVTADD